MKLTITNITRNQISTDIGICPPLLSISANLTPDQLYLAIPGVNALQASGHITFTVIEDGGGEVAEAAVFSSATFTNDVAIEGNLSVNGVGLETTSDLTLYVESTGSDSNPGTQSSPFLTIQAAINSLPKRIKHIVNIKVGAGNFQGFKIVGFTSSSISGTTAYGISILGALAAITPTTGTATGIFTGVTAGSSNTATMSILTDGTQTWTVNDLKGKMIQILTGTGAGTILPIISNTATTITPASTSTGSIGGTYAIIDWTTVITSTVSAPPGLPAAQGTPGAAGTTGILIHDNTSEFPTTLSSIRIERIKLNCSAYSQGAINISGNAGLTIQNVSIIGGASSNTGIVIRNIPSGTVNLQQSYISLVTGALQAILSQSGGGPVSVSNFYISNGGTATSGVVFTGSFTLSAVEIDNCATGASCSGSPANLFLSGSRITNTTGKCIQISSTGSYAGGVNILSSAGVFLKNGGAATAVEIKGPNVANFTGLFIDTALNGIVATNGARCRIASSSTMTNVTNEISVDGTVITLVALRALTPKALSNTTYFTVIHEE